MTYVAGFSDCPNLSVAVIPEGVTYVAGSSFSGCKDLSSVTLPSTLKAIDGSAFKNCSCLKSINLPEGLMYIGDSAFSGAGLTSVSLPKSIRLIGSAFNKCDSLADIQIPADHAISTVGTEKSFESYFSGKKIQEIIALQKLLKETKTHKISEAEGKSLRAEIAKMVGAKSLSSNGSFDW